MMKNDKNDELECAINVQFNADGDDMISANNKVTKVTKI
jgi:hypothetical protein